MFETVRAYVEKLKREKALWRRILCIVCVLSLLVAGGVFWQLHTVGVTKTDEADCGLAEHVHDESCVEKRLVCTLSETQPHVHTDACGKTTETVLICEKSDQPHIHTDECYETI